LREFKNRVLWRIFGPNREEVTGGWRKMHNEELHNLYSSRNIEVENQEDELCGAVCSAHGGDKKSVHFGSEARRKEPFGRLGHRWKVNNKMDLREIGWGSCFI
jgi:hypothetical protein